MTRAQHTKIRSTPDASVVSALSASDASVRLRAALAAGTHPADACAPILIARCAVEPDFFVRDMLTWAIVRLDPAVTLDLLLAELGSQVPQARSQALHSLSKIGDPRAWPAIGDDLLRDPDDEVARTAWRTAAGLVPEGRQNELAQVLASQFGRGDHEVQRSLSRVFVMLGDAAAPVVARARTAADEGVRAHAIATERLMDDPDADFETAIRQAQRVAALRDAPVPPTE